MQTVLKFCWVLFLALCLAHCNSTNEDPEEPIEPNPSEVVCIVSTKYTTGQQVTEAFSETDFDGDCVSDDIDNCFDTYNILQEDADADTVGDYCDICVDVANSDQADNDIDGVGDACDDQSDHDTIPDDTDNCPLMTNEDQNDADIDGVGDICDNCSDVANSDQTDTDDDDIGDACDTTVTECDNSCDLDGDGLGNDCDDDDDGDSVIDDFDVCPLSSGVVDCDDTDGDGVVDTLDNCPIVTNACQTDADEDGMGTECDTNLDNFIDSDGDGISNESDNCDELYDTSNACVDTDGDGIADNHDDCDTLSDPTNGCDDYDGDGVLDSEDNCKYEDNADQGDSDGDGKGNVCDTETCDDNRDNNGDGNIDCADEDCAEEDFCDYDDDGLTGDLDLCPTHADSWWLVPYLWNDFDMNGTADGDGILDLQENLAACDLFHSMACTFVEQDLWGLTSDQLYQAQNAHDEAWTGTSIETLIENELLEPVFFGVDWHMFEGTIQLDEDEDGIGDECEGQDSFDIKTNSVITTGSPMIHP